MNYSSHYPYSYQYSSVLNMSQLKSSNDLMMTNLSASVSLPLHVRVQCARICTFREKSCSKGEDLFVRSQYVWMCRYIYLLNIAFQCEHQLSYNDGRLESVKWYKVTAQYRIQLQTEKWRSLIFQIMNGGTRWVNFYTFTPGGLEKERKQTRHKMEGINILVRCNIYTNRWCCVTKHLKSIAVNQSKTS